ncbi:MAG: 50S ribosomal protein L17 [Alphaproteobacteria bacterium]|nr:50S ribosomal protein L17 [Alphaproteobacteria bacterium]
MRHQKAGRTFNRDTNARKALFIGLAKNLIEKEQIKTTLPKAKDLRSVVEKLVTRAKVDTVANRRLVASELGNASAAAVKKLFTVLGPRYAKRPGGYTRVLKAGFRYGDAAPMAIIEFIDRDVNAKKPAVKPEVAAAKAEEAVATDAEETKAPKAPKAEKAATKKVAAKEPAAKKATAAKKTVAVKRRATGK